MSEQVGASLVLVQIMPPAAGVPGASGTAQAGSGQSQAPVDSIRGTAQPIDITEESSATFASLLTELATLEVQGATGTAPLSDTLIRVRVETRADVDPTGTMTDGNSPPAGGKPGTPDGMILPVPAELQMQPQPAPVEPGSGSGATPGSVQGAGVQPAALPEESIIVAEPRQPATAPPPEQSPLPEISRTAMPPVATAERTVAEPVTGSRPAGPAVSGAIPGISSDADTALEQGGDESGRQMDQQAHTRTLPPIPDRATNGGASISFSHDASGAAASTAATLFNTSMPASTGPAGLLPQTLALSGQPGTWAEPLAERLAGMAARGMNTAEVRLHPPSLGQLEVRITINSSDQASIWLASPNADVREALQQALPRLDGLLNSLGIELAEAEVSDRQPREFGHEDGRDGSTAELTDGTEESRPPVTDSNRLGILDTWA